MQRYNWQTNQWQSNPWASAAPTIPSTTEWTNISWSDKSWPKDKHVSSWKKQESHSWQKSKDKAWIDFTQGLDIRLMDEEIANLVMKCKIKMIHFAWDKEKDSQIIVKKLKEFKKITNIDERKARVYVLVNYDTTFEFDLFRVYELKVCSDALEVV
jgi:hypothetical protein